MDAVERGGELGDGQMESLFRRAVLRATLVGLGDAACQDSAAGGDLAGRPWTRDRRVNGISSLLHFTQQITRPLYDS